MKTFPGRPQRAARKPPRPRTEAEGYGLASMGHSGLRTPDADKAMADFLSLDTDVARAAFADHWLGINGAALEQMWSMSYELLRIVRDRGLYKRPMPDRKQTFETIDDYFGHYFGKGLATFVELEETYQFAHQYAPRLLGEGFTSARQSARLAEVQELATLDEADQEAHPHGGGPSPTGDNTDIIRVKKQYGTGRQNALRKLRNQRPDLYARALAGELSPHRAAVMAGFRPPTMTIRVDDPASAARALKRKFSPAQLRALIAALT